MAIEVEGQVEFVNSETPETEELEIKAKTKISDFFQVTRKSKVESTVILETDDTDITQVNSASETIIDAPVQRTEFVNLFNRAVTVPKCRHNEPCKLLKVKKAGPNKNRSFIAVLGQQDRLVIRKLDDDFLNGSTRVRTLIIKIRLK